MRTLTFEVHGVPRPQGSKRPCVSSSGKMFVREQGGENHKSWRRSVAAVAQSLASQRIEGAVEVHAAFKFERPRSHYGKRHGEPYLKPGMPSFVTRTPDLDKLLRSVFDSVAGVLIGDDSRIASVRSTKSYGERAGVVVTITALESE